MGAERVGEVVEIVDGLVAELHEHVAGFESGFRGGGAGLHVSEFHAICFVAKIRNRSEVWAVALAAAGTAGSVRLNDCYKLRTRGGVVDIDRSLRDHDEKCCSVG